MENFLDITYEPIAEPVPREELKKELTEDIFVRYTNFGNNEIYIFKGPERPALMHEIGRLREIAFRDAGAGTGKPVDIDEFDVGKNMYSQLIVWNPEEEEIVGGYRFIKLAHVPVDEQGNYNLATSHIFRFSRKFQVFYIPKTIELGRSFVQPKYQPSKDPRKGIFSLDNLWDGLGALIIQNPDVKYFFGKMTLYLKFDQLARDLILHFLFKYFPDPERLVYPLEPRPVFTPAEELDAILTGHDYKENHTILHRFVRQRGMIFPPLVNAYMNLSSTMKTFGSALNPEFGPVEEVGILITIADIYPSKKHRHLESYYKKLRHS
jgi:hypothetical protein